jgi:hypothetical protein
LEKRGGWTWFFGGENVVDCVVNVVGKTSFFGDEKYATFLNFIFGGPAECGSGCDGFVVDSEFGYSDRAAYAFEGQANALRGDPTKLMELEGGGGSTV